MTIAVYKIQNKKNGKIYVGQSKNVEKRFKEHKYGLNRGDYYNIHLQRAWDDYGENGFSFEIIKECEPEYLDELEIFYIQFYDTMNQDKGYNLTEGGEGHRGYKHTEEAKRKIGEANKGNIPWNKGKPLPEEDKKKISESMSGKNAPWYGKYCEEHPSWKDYPRIIKDGIHNSGKQNYAIVFNGKRVCNSTNLELLEEKLENNDFTPIHSNGPHIQKYGFRNGKQNYAIVKCGKVICCSIDLEKLEYKLENMKKNNNGDE